MKRPAETLLSRLEGVKGNFPKWLAKCPAHDDGSPSLSIKALDDGRVLVHCFAGCSTPDVLIAVGLQLSDLYPDGPSGELAGRTHKHREPENVLSRSGFHHMQNEIYRLRAKVGAK